MIIICILSWIIPTENDSIPVRICSKFILNRFKIEANGFWTFGTVRNIQTSGRPQIFDYFNKKCFQVYFYIERRVLKTYKNTFQKYLKICPWLFLDLIPDAARLIAQESRRAVLWSFCGRRVRS